MKPSPASSTKIESINFELGSNFRALRFRPDVEQLYQVAIASARKRHLVVATSLSIIFYDVFLINDWEMTPDVFQAALICRLLIFTPLAFAVVATVPLKFSLATTEWAASTMAILATVLIVILFDMSTSPHRLTYHYGSVIIMTFSAAVHRLSIRPCIVAVLGIFTVQIVGLTKSPIIDARILQSDFIFNATVAVLILFAAYGLEHEKRRGFLLATRSNLLNDQLVNVDPLTGLWNRRHLNTMMTAAWAEASSSPRDMAVIILDLDHFKTFNDTYGHLAGDDCLRHVGDCIRRGLALFGDMAVRFGGEEFVIFIADIDAAEAQAAADVLHRAMHEEAIPYPALGEGAIVTASIGLATGLAPFVSAGTLMGQADEALYEAKRAGRDCVRARMIDPRDASRRLPSADTGSVHGHPAPT